MILTGDEWCEFSAEITELHECNNYPHPLTYFDNLKSSQNISADTDNWEQNSSCQFSFKTEDRYHFSFKNETIQEGNKINNLVKLHLDSCYLSSQKGNFIFF